MVVKLTIYILSLFLSISTASQRIVNKLYFKFPPDIKLDTIDKRFPYKIVMTLAVPLDQSEKFSEKHGASTPRNARSFFKPTIADIKTTDSLLKEKILEGVIGSDSLLFVKNQLYTHYGWEATDFHKYKANRNELYESNAERYKRKIRRSDRYYFGFMNDQNKKYIVVLFDPKKIRSVKMGCIRWVDFCDPFVVEFETSKVLFAYGLYPDPE